MQNLDKKYKELLTMTSKLAKYKEKVKNSEKDLQRSV